MSTTVLSNYFVISLGAENDGEPGAGESCPDKNYIMSRSHENDDMLTNKFMFSCCSQRSIYGTIWKYV